MQSRDCEAIMTTTPTDETRRVLDLLSQGKITVDEAEQLLRALKEAPADGDAPRGVPRWVRITVDKTERDGRPARTVNIRVPLALAKSGIRLGAIIPHLLHYKMNQRLRDEGVNVEWSKIDLSQIETALNDLGETTIDVDDGKAQVRVRCE
jgi:SHOCT-like protein